MSVSPKRKRDPETSAFALTDAVLRVAFDPHNVRLLSAKGVPAEKAIRESMYYSRKDVYRLLNRAWTDGLQPDVHVRRCRVQTDTGEQILHFLTEAGMTTVLVGALIDQSGYRTRLFRIWLDPVTEYLQDQARLLAGHVDALIGLGATVPDGLHRAKFLYAFDWNRRPVHKRLRTGLH